MPWRKQAQAYRKREDALYDKLITRAVSGEASGMNTYVLPRGYGRMLRVVFYRWAAVFAREDKPEGDQRQLMNQFAGVSESYVHWILETSIHTGRN